MSGIETRAEHRCFGGTQGFYVHASSACAGPMRFAVYVPPQAAQTKVPVVYWLSGLTCSDENFPVKAGAHRYAAELGLMLVAPDTSPRDTGIPGEADDWQVGAGAGYYVDATEPPWAKHFRMYTYVTAELPSLIAEHFPADPERQSISGHSVGGHGALTIALKHPDRYRSVSAFAPMVAPMRVGWGELAFTRFLGSDRERWKPYDATELVAHRRFPGTILIDQGESDTFLRDYLRPELFAGACERAGQPVDLRLRPRYDHSYYFVASFIEEHLRFHAEALGR